MTRVSENSSLASLQYSINKAKKKLEDLQLKGSSLKDVTRPSDNPVANIEYLKISSHTDDNKQYLRNADYSLLLLNTTEKSLELISEILVKAKEIAISQASDFYNPDVRKNVANEVIQLRNEALSIANKRIGSRFIFAGHSTLNRPFSNEGEYLGDTGKINLEISKDYFVPVNLNGKEVFFSEETNTRKDSPLEPFQNDPQSPLKRKNQEIELKDEDLRPSRDLASVDGDESLSKMEKRDNIFAQLATLTTALENNDSDLVKNLLEKLDSSLNRIITLRTKIGSVVSTIETTKSSLSSENLDFEDRKSKLVDADIAELFTDLAKQQDILKTTYQSGRAVMNQKLIDFLK